MVIAGRLDWLRLQIQNGAHTHLTISPAADPLKCKFKITVDNSKQMVCPTTRDFLIAALDTLSVASRDQVVMDRGHKHSNGISEIALWISPVANRIGANDPEDGPDGDDDKPGDHHESPYRPDPWQDGKDPWYRHHKKQNGHPHSQAFSTHPRKQPRTRGLKMSWFPKKLPDANQELPITLPSLGPNEWMPKLISAPVPDFPFQTCDDIIDEFIAHLRQPSQALVKRIICKAACRAESRHEIFEGRLAYQYIHRVVMKVSKCDEQKQFADIKKILEDNFVMLKNCFH